MARSGRDERPEQCGDALACPAVAVRARRRSQAFRKVPLQANALPNTGVNVPGIGQLTLNEQATDANGVLTVNALHLSLLPALGGANVVIGHVSCGGAPATAPVPMISAPVAGGTTAAAAFGGVVYLRRRRRSIFDAS